MAKIKTYYLNILESSTVTSTPSADSDFPVYRLYDRHIGRSYKAGSVAETTIHVDQGATTINEVDTLIIPANHNLDGLVCTLSYSDNDIDWTQHHQWTQSGSAIIERSFSAITHRYLRLVISGPASVVTMHEMMLTKAYEWDRNPESIGRGVYPVFNVERREDTGGRPRYLELGDSRQARIYALNKIHDSGSKQDNTELQALNNAWAGKKPFYMKDHDATLLFGELVEPLELSVSGDYIDAEFNFLEVIP